MILHSCQVRLATRRHLRCQKRMVSLLMKTTCYFRSQDTYTKRSKLSVEKTLMEPSLIREKLPQSTRQIQKRNSKLLIQTPRRPAAVVTLVSKKLAISAQMPVEVLERQMQTHRPAPMARKPASLQEVSRVVSMSSNSPSIRVRVVRTNSGIIAQVHPRRTTLTLKLRLEMSSLVRIPSMIVKHIETMNSIARRALQLQQKRQSQLAANYLHCLGHTRMELMINRCHSLSNRVRIVKDYLKVNKRGILLLLQQLLIKTFQHVVKIEISKAVFTLCFNQRLNLPKCNKKHHLVEKVLRPRVRVVL